LHHYPSHFPPDRIVSTRHDDEVVVKIYCLGLYINDSD